VVTREIKVNKFYAALLGDVQKAKESRDDGQPARTKVAESRERILGRIKKGDIQGDFQEKIDDLLKNVSFLFYRRGYKDAGHHQMTLNPIRRTPEKRKRFNMAVTKMLESDIEMETEEICAELDRQKVTCYFKIRGALEEIGPRSWPWTQKPIPGAVTAAIERIRADITSQNYARKRQSLLSSTANDKHRKAKAATQGS
jgi:hypothetical protein